ncbi:hypothetical protein [Mesorhizobium sp. M4B.F.Ca.ET.013.02.1.1]|uniref:hypothetical protein n=1 Tax=Mesorhizobium sp. M4B.F.Ca.ET.013.02.1.1 TaxID=2496755 RepID=UPI000FD55A57|nr:hypothetical protein [Mesorhizobium sp. M4B.F.Ca.ET.013.02.1.1]RUW19896.1 hypothetical protein EOA34_28460 [Mesorhizobium sp. M4B.F.Ca.ET.013.02.1.1]
MLNRGPFPCDVHRVAEQCGIRILKPDQHYAAASSGRVCFCPKTLKRIGRAYGEDHLRLVLRLIVESEGNAGALQMEPIAAVSNVVLSGLVEIRADLLDDVDLEQLRAWAQVARPKLCSTTEAMTVALLWRFASPDIIMPAPSAEKIAAEERRREIMRKSRANAKRRRLKAAGAAAQHEISGGLTG